MSNITEVKSIKEMEIRENPLRLESNRNIELKISPKV